MSQKRKKEDELLFAIFDRSFTEWVKKYGKLYFSLSMHFNISAAIKILILAEGRSVNTQLSGNVLLYKYEDENNEMFRSQVPDIPIEDLEKHLSNL